jgi:pyrroline-5-carboxylate reductase
MLHVMSDHTNIKQKKILFIGGGNMAAAIIAGLVKTNGTKNQENQQNIFVIDRHAAKLAYLKEQYNIHVMHDLTKLPHKIDIIILAVKPTGIKQACFDLLPYCNKDSLIISVAAGVSINYLSKQLPGFNNIIRTMPNTPATIGRGVTVLYHNIELNSDYYVTIANKLFNTIGKTLWVTTEAEINTTMAISGCGPAYIFLLCESLMAGAENLGLDQTIAKQLITHTIAGACELYTNSTKSPDILRQEVTSPNGTTAAALAMLDPELTKKTYIKALQAAVNKAKLIEQELVTQEIS